MKNRDTTVLESVKQTKMKLKIAIEEDEYLRTAIELPLQSKGSQYLQNIKL